MIKNGLFVTALIIVLCLIPGSTLAKPRISVKLQGGWAYLQAGDVNAGTQAFYDWGKIYFAPPAGALIQGGYLAIHRGYEFGGDVIFELSRNFGVGIGAGFLKSSRYPRVPSELMVIIDNPQGAGLAQEFLADSELNAIPLRLGLFMTVPLGWRLEFTANAGVSWYFKAKYRGGWSVSSGPASGVMEHPAQWLTTVAEKKNAPIGFQGGVGLQYKLIRRITLFIEGQGRYAKFHGLEGTSVWEAGTFGGLFPPFSERGKLYYESVPMIPGSPRLIMVQSNPPAGPGGQPREGVIDFSGISLQAGVRIYF